MLNSSSLSHESARELQKPIFPGLRILTSCSTQRDITYVLQVSHYQPVFQVLHDVLPRALRIAGQNPSDFTEEAVEITCAEFKKLSVHSSMNRLNVLHNLDERCM